MARLTRPYRSRSLLYFRIENTEGVGALLTRPSASQLLLFYVPCSLFLVSCSLFLVPCFLFLVPCFLFLANKEASVPGLWLVQRAAFWAALFHYKALISLCMWRKRWVRNSGITNYRYWVSLWDCSISPSASLFPTPEPEPKIIL